VSPEQAFYLLGVTSKADLRAVTRAYRRKAFDVHPDRNDSPKAAERMSELTAAYAVAKEEVAGSEAVLLDGLKCTDGTPLEDLGKGFPVTQNSVPCPSCDGRGYLLCTKRSVHECTACTSTPGTFSRREGPCPRCKGTGKYYNKAGRLIGECFRCRGRGTVPGYCPVCNGMGRVMGPVTTTCTRCTRCDGVGEILVKNPVITKGALG